MNGGMTLIHRITDMANLSAPSFSLALLILFFLSGQSNGHQSTFIIHVSQSHKPSTFLTTTHWYTSILHSLPSSPSPLLLYSYHHVATGFSALLTNDQASKLLHHPAILSIVSDQPRHLHTTHTPLFLHLADDSGIWPNSDYARDVIVGVLDTGIWPERRSFNSTDGLSVDVPDGWKGKCEVSREFPAESCNGKIIGARAFYKGYEAALGRPIDESVESKSPRDTEGHGTHTASTAAGSVVENAGFYHYATGQARGMATKARIAAYKICWSLGCFDSDILAAMDQAVSDGVDVISLSVGANGYAPPYDKDSIAIGAFGAAQHGVLVSCSAGNSGPGPFTAVNIAPWILTVGASTVDREFPATVVLGDGRVFNGVSLYSGDSSDSNDFMELIYASDCGSKYCYEGQLDASKVAGKMVICDRGGNARVAKGNAVKLAGGKGMILANTEDSGEELVADSHLIPALMVGQIAGDKIKDYLITNPNPTAKITFQGTIIGSNPSAPRVAAFSSRGPNHLTGDILKPDVIAPGVNILAGWTGFVGPTTLEIDPRRVEFNIISGTSMSCPHVSGLAALLRKAYPSWSPAAIKSALMTTAYNVDNSGNNITDLATNKQSTPFIHGSGHVDPNKALDPGLVYDISPTDYVSFLCSIGYDSKKISIFLREPTSVDCTKHNLSSPGNLNYPSFSVVFKSGNGVNKYTRVVRNVGSSVDAVYELSVSSPPNVDVNVSPRKLVFSAENRTLSYEVTFTSLASSDTSIVGSSSFGSIEWSDRVHFVRSPIAARWIQGLEQQLVASS